MLWRLIHNIGKFFLFILIGLGPITAAHCQEKSLGPWQMARVVRYREHPDDTTAKLKWCVEHNSGDSECGAAMQACSDLLKGNP
jgi:hypothetical protein